MPDVIEFTLNDAKDEPHEYTCTLHKTSDGTRLCWRIMGMAGEPIGRLVGSNIKELVDIVPVIIQKAQAADTDEALFDTLKGEIQKIDDLDLDFAQIIRDIQGAVIDAGDEKFFRSILKNTYRDGKPIAKESVYEQVYQANYMEQFQAVWQVIRVNGFLPLLATA